MDDSPPRGVARLLTFAILVLTVAQLVVAATVASELPQFAGKGFGARLVGYPVAMLLVPFGWWLRRRVTRNGSRPPWPAFALLMAPFAVDVTGNTLDLYDSVVWWDDANHLVNWFMLCTGIGLLLRRTSISPPWALGWLVAGAGALLAIGWELGEWYTFIRHGTELDTAYQDTLGDQTLGSIGAGLAGALVVLLVRRSRSGTGREP